MGVIFVMVFFERLTLLMKVQSMKNIQPGRTSGRNPGSQGQASLSYSALFSSVESGFYGAPHLRAAHDR